MKIEFKDGHKIKFMKCGNVWLAESAIWDDTDIHASFDELHKLKVKINRWFKENAPKKISSKFKARLPQWNEIESLPFKDQILYMEGRTDRIVDYFLGDEDDYLPVLYLIRSCKGGYKRFYCNVVKHDWDSPRAVRLCLEER